MADRTKIEWCDTTWNPIAGCTRVSEGCRNCYATPIAARFQDTPAFTGLARYVDRPDGTREARWTGAINVREHLMDQPLRRQAPRRIFVNSMSDLFHDAVPDEVIDRIFAVMALCPQHTFQILTKRPERMRRYLASAVGRIADAIVKIRESDAGTRFGVAPNGLGPLSHLDGGQRWFPLPNVWLGVSVEDQVTADIRRPYLKSVADDGWNTFVSYEPALGLVEWTGWEFIKWLISGGESGPNARPSHPDWHREATITGRRPSAHWWDDKWIIGSTKMDDPEDGWMDEPDVYRIGKRAAGRWLDGVIHNGMPGSI